MENINIYFDLSFKQRKKLHSMGYNHVLLEHIPLNDFKKITKNKDLINRFIKYKFRLGLRLVKAV